jgi:hypothetical protein
MPAARAPPNLRTVSLCHACARRHFRRGEGRSRSRSNKRHPSRRRIRGRPCHQSAHGPQPNLWRDDLGRIVCAGGRCREATCMSGGRSSSGSTFGNETYCLERRPGALDVSSSTLIPASGCELSHRRWGERTRASSFTNRPTRMPSAQRATETRPVIKRAWNFARSERREGKETSAFVRRDEPASNLPVR